MNTGNRSIRVAALGLAFLAVPLMALAGEKVDQSLAVPNDAVIQIENTRGKVAIAGWDKSEVEVVGELDDLAEKLIFEVDDKHVLIKVKIPQKNVNWGDGSDLRIRVPEGSRLGFNGVSSDVELKGVTGGASLRTVSGDIEISNVTNQLIANSVSGDIKVSGATGKVQFSTISGDMDLTMTTRQLRLDTVSGDVDVRLSDFSDLSAESVSGELTIDGKLATQGRVEISSVSGDVNLKLAEPVNARLNVRTGIGGDITNDINDDQPRDLFPGQQELKTTAGDGSGNISIRTVTADVKLN